MKKTAFISLILVFIVALSPMFTIAATAESKATVMLMGDVDGDGKVSVLDATAIQRIVAKLIIPTEEMLIKAKVTGGDDVTILDATEIQRYIAKISDNGNINVELPSEEYTVIFKDYDGSVLYAETVKWGMSANAPETPQRDGYVFVKWDKSFDKVTEDLVVTAQYTKGYSIKYNISNGDKYLADLCTIDNSSNPTYYSGEQNIALNGLEAPDGYVFLGWYDGAGNNATQVKQIAKGTSGNIQLYAHWYKVTYTISFASDMVPVEKITYTTDQEVALPTPKLDKYTFVGWSDKNGKLFNSITKGTTGNITLYANWSSNRNRAKAVSILKDPIILEDSNKGLLLFTYEIGSIENVPLFTTQKLNCVNGLISSVEITTENSISTERAETVAQTISNATTNSSSWTLSNNWNKTTEVSQSYLDQTGQERQEAEELAKSQSNTYNLNKSVGGENSNLITSTGAFKLSGNQSHSETNTTESGQNFELSIDGKYTRENSAGIELGIPVEGLDLGINAGRKSTFEIGAGVDYSNYVKHTNTGTDSWSNSAEVSGEKTRSYTATKNWNTSEGFSSSNSISTTSSVSNTISKLISQQYGYGESYAEGGSNSSAQELASTESKSDEFSTTMTYYTSDIKRTTTSFTSTGNTTGDYRLVMAGTVHVFAVVGYDVANSTYFVYTYNVLDDKTEEYLDYSYDGSFDDYETSIIPFEVPSFVNDYVNNRIAMTDGLRLDPEAGMIDKYTPNKTSPATIISVPSYVSLDNGDGTYDSVKVTSISSDLFRNNKDIAGVILGHHITEIPANAFEGCTSLKYVIAPGVTKIGENAFSGCTSLQSFSVPREVTDVGKYAFDGVPEVTAEAANSEVAMAIASSGAESIILDIGAIDSKQTDNLAFDVGNIDYFELRGKNREYVNLSLKSGATTTVINGVTIKDSTKVALELSSKNITFNRVNINSSGYSTLLTADNAKVTLNGNNNFTSASGKTFVSKNITLEPMSISVVGKLKVTGKVLVYGKIDGSEYLISDGIEYIDKDTYDQYAKGMFDISFDANGGTLATTNKSVIYGNVIGELPVPTRDYYTFEGWYTEDDIQVKSDTVFNYLSDITLKAKWTQNPVSGWVKAADVPTGAEVVGTKWTYIKTETTTSYSPTLDGWTQTGSSWQQSGSGTHYYASYPGGYNGSKNYSTSALGNYENTTDKRTVSGSSAHRYIYWHWCRGAHFGSNVSNYNRKIESYYTSEFKAHHCFESSTSVSYDSAADAHWYVNQGACDDTCWWYKFTVYKQTYTNYKKLFSYSKTTNLESSTEVTSGNGISNVQKWVQYRAK